MVNGQQAGHLFHIRYLHTTHARTLFHTHDSTIFEPRTVFDLIYLFFSKVQVFGCRCCANVQSIWKFHSISIVSLHSFLDLPVYGALDHWADELERKRWKNICSRNGKESNCNQANSTRLCSKWIAFFCFSRALSIFLSFLHFYSQKNSAEYDFIAWKSAFCSLSLFLYALVALAAMLVSFWLHFTFYTFENSSGFVERCSLLLCNICVVMF